MSFTEKMLEESPTGVELAGQVDEIALVGAAAVMEHDQPRGRPVGGALAVAQRGHAERL